MEVIEYTTTKSSKTEVTQQTKSMPVVSGKVVEMGSRVKESEVSQVFFFGKKSLHFKENEVLR